MYFTSVVQQFFVTYMSSVIAAFIKLYSLHLLLINSLYCHGNNENMRKVHFSV